MKAACHGGSRIAELYEQVTLTSLEVLWSLRIYLRSVHSLISLFGAFFCLVLFCMLNYMKVNMIFAIK